MARHHNHHNTHSRENGKNHLSQRTDSCEISFFYSECSDRLGHDGHVKHTEAKGLCVEQEKAKTTSGFVARVTSIPIVNDSVSTVQAYASRSSLATYAFNKANSSLNTVSSYQPKYVQTYYQTYVQPHLEKADKLGCKSLDLLQDRFPVINQPTQQVIEAVKAPPKQIITGVRGRIDSTINTVTAPGYAAAREANKRVGFVVDSLEATLNRYLPAEDKKTKDIPDGNHVLRTYLLLTEASQRVSKLVSDQVAKTTSAVPRSRDDLIKLKDSSPLLQSVASQLQFFQETVRHSITVYSKAAEQHLPKAITDHVHKLHEALNEQLSQLTTFVRARTELPEWLKQCLQSLQEAANSQYQFAKQQYNRKDITSYEKAKIVGQSLQNQLLPALQQAQTHIQQYTVNMRERAQIELKSRLGALGFGHNENEPAVATTTAPNAAATTVEQ